jgi:hypothetical protein
MRVIVFMQKELEDWWGIDDLLEDNADLSVDEQNALILELLMEDVSALTDDATWRFARMKN